MKNILLLCACFYAGLAQSQSYTWKGAENFSCCTTINGFAFDKNGNIFVSGTFYGDTYVGSFYLTSTTAFHYNSYIAKLNSAGTVLWAKVIGSNDDCRTAKICIDKLGNVFISGYFSTDLVYGNKSLSSSGQIDAFIMKINNSGTLQWASQTNGASSEFYRDVAVDNAGNAYVTGSFYGIVTIGSYTVTTPTQDMVTVKYNGANGTPIWVQQSNSTSPGNCSAYSIAADRFGNIYVLGSYGGGITNFQSYSLNSSNPYDYFISKINSGGSYSYAYDAGDIPDGSLYNVATDTAGNIYIAGNFGGFFPYTATIGGLTITSSHNSDIFAAKFNSSFTMQWLHQGGSTTRGDYANDIVASKNGDLYITFTGGSSVNFSGVVASSSHPGNNDIGIIKYNNAGTPQWASVSGGTGYDGVSLIDLLEKTHTVAISGLSDVNAYFGGYQVAASGGYIAGLTDNTAVASAQNKISSNISSSISVYPVPAHTSITITGLPVNGQIFLYDIKGSLVINKNISGSIMNLNVSGLKGNYMLQVLHKNRNEIMKFLKQ